MGDQMLGARRGRTGVACVALIVLALPTLVLVAASAQPAGADGLPWYNAISLGL